MIVTVTANPSIDRTAALAAPLERGGVNRINDIRDSVGGKGINVARVISGAHPKYEPPAVEAVFPAAPGDPFIGMVDAIGLAYTTVETQASVRVNLTLTEADGTTTKLNAPGAALDATARDALLELIMERTRGLSSDSWVVLSGSLPAGTPPDFYIQCLDRLADTDVRCALDTSDVPLQALGVLLRDQKYRFARIAPQLIKPNGMELGQLLGIDGLALEQQAEQGDVSAVAEAALQVHHAGIESVLVTLGGAGAVLATDGSAWWSSAPAINVASTVGAGDSSLAGYVLAATQGFAPADRLRWAVVHGSITASLPGTELARGIDMSTAPEVTVTQLD